MLFGPSWQAGFAGGIDFDFERGTFSEVGNDGTLHIRSDDRSYILAPSRTTVPAMPPIASPDLWAWWCASILCCGIGTLVLLATSVVADNGWSSRGRIVTLVALAVAAAGTVVASLKIWRVSRETRPRRDDVLAAVRNLTGLPVTRRQARRFLSATTHYVVSADGTAWAVHERNLYRGNRTI
ncbi:hypothetical protein [Aeromicrobium choanae]|uniref:hypothetical protein n=1 Tax=Aeromicrobium choanae TaxID=1736691 RepID=UPI00099AD20D|nr:hypothetical protein [Aeromicrobium choanae]